MCFTDCDPAIVYRSKMRLARKPHRCYECSGAISEGQRYESVSALWERGDGFQTVATCLRCIRLRECIIAVENANGCGPYESFPPHGGLYESLDDYDGIRGLIRDMRRLGLQRPRVAA